MTKQFPPIPLCQLSEADSGSKIVGASRSKHAYVLQLACCQVDEDEWCAWPSSLTISARRAGSGKSSHSFWLHTTPRSHNLAVTSIFCWSVSSATRACRISSPGKPVKTNTDAFGKPPRVKCYGHAKRVKMGCSS